MEHENFDRRSFLKVGSAIGAGLFLGKELLAMGNEKYMAPISAGAMPTSFKPIETVKIGIVGVGSRGMELLHILMNLEGNVVKAVCDIIPERAEHAQKVVQEAGHPKPTAYTRGERDFERLCEKEELDLVITATPVDWHVPVCASAMKNDKHSATEVHATYKMDECWELVETAEKYRKQCGMLENYCYFYNVLMVLKMVRTKLLGDLVFSEAGYQHDCRAVRFDSKGDLLWRAKDLLTHNGNLYPTHAVGPVAQWFNINRGDKFDYLVSMSSRPSGMKVYAEEHFGKNHPSVTRKYLQGDMSSTMIKTAKGATITLYYDASLPRPFDMIYRVQGTKGIYMGSTDQIYVEGKSPNYEQYEPVKNYLPEYEHPLWTTLGEKAKGWSHWGADYIMMYRLVESFRKGEPFELDVYDAATWSVISPLSEQSVANKSKAIDFPDFTRGKWKTNPPLGILEA